MARDPDCWLLFACVCFFLSEMLKEKKMVWNRCREGWKRMWLEMEGKDYHWEARWNWTPHPVVTLIHVAVGFFSRRTPSFIVYSSIQQKLMNACHVPGTVLGQQHMVMNEIDKVSALEELGNSWKGSYFKFGSFSPRRWPLSLFLKDGKDLEVKDLGRRTF